MPTKEQYIVNFTAAEAVEPWQSVDDRVMGGVSQSTLIWKEQYASFRGTLSSENNGGFASVRAFLNTRLPDSFDHLWIESKGDERRYSLLLRTNKTPSGISYQTDFLSTKEFTRIELPMSDFVAQFRGRIVLDAPELSAGDIIQMGIIVSSAQYGNFQLDIKSIGAIDMQ